MAVVGSTTLAQALRISSKVVMEGGEAGVAELEGDGVEAVRENKSQSPTKSLVSSKDTKVVVVVATEGEWEGEIGTMELMIRGQDKMEHDLKQGPVYLLA